jgi:hypothetical protein
MIKIPDPIKGFVQSNRTNTLGNIYAPGFSNIWATFNMDFFVNLGAARVSDRLKLLGKTGDSGFTNLDGTPTAILEWSGRIWFIGGSRLFRSSTASTGTAQITFAEDDNTGARTSYISSQDDLCAFNSTLVATDNSSGKIYSLNIPTSGTWTDRGVLFSSAAQLGYFKKFNRLYALDYGNNKISSVDTSWVISSTAGTYSVSFVADDGGIPQCMAMGSDRIWIGFKRGTAGATASNNSQQFCSVVEWDGISAQITKEYKIPAQGIMSIVMRQDVPVVMDTNGILREYNGTAFVEIGRLPLRLNESLITTNQPGWVYNFIHPRQGLVITKDNTILAYINALNATNYSTSLTINENLSSGIWEFDGKGSATHKQSISYMPTSSTSVTDHGQSFISEAGSFANIKISSVSTYGINSYFIGAKYYTDATTTTYGIFMDAPTSTTLSTYPEGQKYGYFVSTWGSAPSVQENWQKVWLNFKQLLNNTDKIVVKYRLTEASPTEATITWTSTTTFTTTTDLSAYWTSGTGGEVEIIRGKGGGKCAHITSIVNNSGTYTVTVDETYAGCTSGTAQARFQNWIKSGSYSSQTDESAPFPVMKSSSRIQIKVCLQFTGDNELFDVNIISQTLQPMQ